MQLDNIGHKDLERWQEIQRAIFGSRNPSDIITLYCVNNSANLDNCFWINGKNTTVKDKGAKESYTDADMSIFSAYTYIANLTKRIMNDNSKFVNDEENKDRVKKQATEDLIKSMMPKKYKHDGVVECNAAGLVNIACDAKYLQPPQAVALIVNKKISDIMSRHFES